MTADHSTFLACHRPIAEERVVWPSGTELAVTYYLVDKLPPLDLVTSVRCIVLRGDEVLVIRAAEGSHILPGGRREPGETVEETLRREVLEETGWTVAEPRLVGCLRLRHLTPRPEDYPYPYPEFQHLIYVAEPATHHPERVIADPFDGPADFEPVDTVRALLLEGHQRALLDAAVLRLGAGREQGRE